MDGVEHQTFGDLSRAGVLEFGDGYRTKRTELSSSGFRIVRVADISSSSGVQLDSPDFVDQDYRRAIGAKAGKAGDVLLTTKGTVGRVAVLHELHEEVVYSPQLCYFRVHSTDVLDQRYLRYWFSGPSFLRQAADRMNNTDMAAYINLADIRSLRIDMPSIETQRAIAEVLGALDDKIAANTKLAETADEFLSSEFTRLLAEASDIQPLGTIADVNNTTIRPVKDGNLRYIDIASVGVGHYDFPDVSPWNEAPSRARRALRKGDTIWSTVRPNRRSHALILSDDQLLVGSTGLAVLSPREVGFAYLYEVAKRPEFTAYLETVAEGSAYPAVRADKFLDAPVPMLSAEDRDGFETTASVLRLHVEALIEENQTLAATRDALLPQLMSGKLRVKDAEQTVGELI